MILKSLGRVNLIILLNIIFLVGVNFAMNYWITMVLKKRIIYNFINIESLCFIQNLICYIYALSLDWDKLKIEVDDEEVQKAAEHIGFAYALVGILRRAKWDAAKRHIIFPNIHCL